MAAKKRKRKAKPTPEEIEKREYRKEIRGIFSKVGFTKVTGVSDKPLKFKGREGDFDDIFIFKNIIVFIEYTLSKEKNVGDHLLPKKILFDHVVANKNGFLEYMDEKFETFKNERTSKYSNDQYRIRILYCSKNPVQKQHKDQVPCAKYFDYPIVKYFKSVSEGLRLSTRFEFLNFLELKPKEIGDAIIKNVEQPYVVKGTVLPESHSNFPTGYKVVSFYIDPDTLLKKCYVLRKDGWENNSGLYQRMIINAKIKSLRKYLAETERVFINNIIVTLPSKTKVLDNKDNTVDPSTLRETKPVKIQIPDGYNNIGLIDGQHRVYAYHEGGENDSYIADLRVKQNLLVTGIIYPEGTKADIRTKFEARLFLEINANQSNAKSDLKQAIGVLLRPYTSESIARVVIDKLNMEGPLENHFEKHFYEKGRIKTTSIVSYGLKPIVKLSGNDSLYNLWSKQNKAELSKEKDRALLDEYIIFCVKEINLFISAVKAQLKESGSGKWTFDKKQKDKVLSTVGINAFIICLRHLIEHNATGTFESYRKSLKGLENFDFSVDKSSSYNSMAKKLCKEYFNIIIE
jgi:DGQHR domain-containing protein